MAASGVNGPSAAGTLERVERNRGTVYHVGDYKVRVTKDRVVVTDKTTGEKFTVHGDPHVLTSDGDKGQFHEDNLTLDLRGGVKITIKPTEKDANGLAWVDEVAIMDGDRATVVTNVHQSPKYGSVASDAAASVDLLHDDGTVLQAFGALSDPVIQATGGEFEGIDPSQPFSEWLLDGLGGNSDFDYGAVLAAIRGGDVYQILHAILQDLEQQHAGLVGEMRALYEQRNDLTTRLEEIDDPEDPLYQKLERKLGSLNGKLEQLTFELQQAAQATQLYSDLRTNLSRLEYEAQKGVIDNIRP